MSVTTSPSERSKPKIHPFLRALLGFLLLLPACALCSFNLLPLTMNTFMGSFRSFSLAGSGDFVGMNNYGRLFDNPSFPDSFGFTILLIVLHVLAATIFPPVLAVAVNSLGKKLHRGVQLLFTLPLAFFGPALVIYGPTFMRGLWNTESPERTYLLIDSVAGLAISCGVGLIVYSAVLRGRRESQGGWKPILRPLIITWLVAQLATAAYVLQSFNSLSGLLPNFSSAPLGYFLFQTFRLFQGGITFASSAVILIVAAVFGIVAALLLILSKVHLRFETHNETTYPPARGIFTTLGWITIAVGGIAVFFIAVLPWFIALFRSITLLGDGLFGVSLPWVWVNSIVPPLLVILFIQLPVAYLGALGIGVVRPLGRGSRWLLLLFSPWLFVTALPLAFAAFNRLQEIGLLDTIVALAPPILLSVPMLFILTLFFIGHESKWREARAQGIPATRAMFQQLIVPSLPLAGLIAAFSLLAATQELVMPLLVGLSPEQLTATTAILKLSTSFSSGTSSSLVITLFGLPIFLIFFAVFAVLQASYLGRLTLVSESVDEMKQVNS